MHKKLEKFDQILEKDLETKLDEIIKAGTITPSEVKTVTDAVRLMLKTKEYEEWLNMDQNEMSDHSYGYSSYGPIRSSVTGRFASNGVDFRGRDISYGRPAPMADMYYGNNYDSSRSGHSVKDRMVAKLEDMMGMVNNDYERQEIKDAIYRIQQGN